MRVVIDTNRLESEELRIFLGASTANQAVLPEHGLSEVFKPASIDAIISAHTVLCEFPAQVVVLHGNRRSARVNPRSGGISNCFIDRKATRDFPVFCARLREAAEGHEGYRQQLMERHRWALDRTATDLFDDQSEALAELRSSIARDDLRRLGNGEPLSNRFRSQIIAGVHRLARILLEHRADAPPLPNSPARYNHFVWRYALCHTIQAIRLLGDGAQRRKPEKAVNDHIDNVLSTYGTYFNGIMTMDRGPMATQAIARIILGSLGARLGEDYLNSGYIIKLLDELEEPSA